MTERMVPLSINNILVAVDGSVHSKKGIELAVDLAKLWNAKIYFIHVWEHRDIPKGFEKYAKDEKIPYLNYFDLVDKQLLYPAEERAKKAKITKVERISVTGEPADEILKAAENHKVDLIILGSRGLGRFSRAFLGSVSTKVLHHAHCTCITVK